MQFTLCHVLKGNKPDFHNALTSEQSEPMYQDFLKLLSSIHRPDAIKGQRSHSTEVMGSNSVWFAQLIRWRVWCRDASAHTE